MKDIDEKYKNNQAAKEKDDDDDDDSSTPPPWLDEYEYIDWCMTH